MKTIMNANFLSPQCIKYMWNIAGNVAVGVDDSGAIVAMGDKTAMLRVAGVEPETWGTMGGLEICWAGCQREAVFVDRDGDSYVLRSGAARYPVEHWDNRECPAGAREVDFRCSLSMSALAQIAVAMPVRDYRKILNGVAFDPTGVAVATNGRALIARGVNVDSRACNSAVRVVPAWAIKLAIRLSRKRNSVTVSTGEGGFVIDVAGYEISGACVDGKFPDWRRVLPDESRARVWASMDRAELMDACKTAARVLSGHDKPFVQFAPVPGGVEMRPVFAGQFSVVIPGSIIKPVTFNPGLLMELVGATAGNTVELRGVADCCPFVVNTAGDSISLIMPVG